MARNTGRTEENKRAARLGRTRLMLKLPAARSQIQSIAEGSAFDEVFEAYGIACSALDGFRHSLYSRDGARLGEYEKICAEIEADVLQEISRLRAAREGRGTWDLVNGNWRHRGRTMISVDTVRDKKILLITPQGPLTRADFQTIANEFERAVASTGKLTGLLIKTRSFPGWETFEAITAHLKFIAAHHRSIERVAVVTESRFLRVIPRLARYFVHPTIRVFAFEETEKALGWLENGDLRRSNSK